MPELRISRNAGAALPMVCMYCGAVATSRQEQKVLAPLPTRGGGTDIVPVPSGDDPVSGVIGLLMLPLVLWGAVTSLASLWGTPREKTFTRVPRAKPSMIIAITTCDRHQAYRRRFVWPALVLVLGLLAFWFWAIRVVRRDMGTDHTDMAVTLLLTAILATVLLPVAFSVWYHLAGPVIVDRVTDDGVILDRVRLSYFHTTGGVPYEVQ